jgi:post-segregation antitoxin CcdA
MPESAKQKLTLSVSKDAVEKARKIGLNLSELTEKVLQGRTSIPSEADEADVYSHYQHLVDSMAPFIDRYRLLVHIGDWDIYDEDGDPIARDTLEIGRNGKIWKEGDTTQMPEEVKLKDIPLHALFDGNKILSKFIEALAEAKQENQERIDQLQLANRIIQVMNESLQQNSEKSSSLPAKSAKSIGEKQPG